MNLISYYKKPPSLESVLGPALKLIQENGRIHVDDLEILHDLSRNEKLFQLRLLQNSIKTLNEECIHKSNNINTCFIPNKTPLLTLFTTWMYDEEKLDLHKRTLQNFKALPDINVIVFSNCSKVKQVSEQAAWTVLPVIKEADGCPVLSNMFLQAQQKFNSVFYGYANGDLLFTGGLIGTLKKILCEFGDKKNILVVGKRTNVFASLLKDLNSQFGKEVDEYAFKYGKRFQPDALDYFITDKYFPWENFLPLVVGHRAYDNWVLAYARHKNFTVIDVSDSVTCLHQTLEKRGNYESQAKGDYNVDIIETQDVSMSYATWGRSCCAEWRTWTDLCGSIVTGQRNSIPSDCYQQRSFYWLQL